MSEQALKNWIKFALLCLLVLCIISMANSCKPKEITTTQTEYVKDTASVVRLQRKVDSVSQLATRYREEVTTLTIENAVLQSGRGRIDSTLPDPEYRKWTAGDNFFELWYQGELNRYNFYLAPRESSNREVKDSSAFWQKQWQLAQDSLKALNEKSTYRLTETETVEKIGFWEKTWILVKNAWWLMIVGAVLWIVVKNSALTLINRL